MREALYDRIPPTGVSLALHDGCAHVPVQVDQLAADGSCRADLRRGNPLL
jgi:hypothetical protein